MGFSKNKGRSVVIALIVLVMFNVIAFALPPCKHTILFWLGYTFETFSVLSLLAVSLVAIEKASTNNTFLGLPPVNLTWIYFILQSATSLWQMTYFQLPYSYGIIINSCLAGIYLICLILTFAASDNIKQLETATTQKVTYIKELQTNLELLTSDDTEVLNKIGELVETVRFSDPISHSQLSDIESKINKNVYLLQNNINDKNNALQLCNEIKQLFQVRNKKCALLKNVSEPQSYIPDNSGIKIVTFAFGIIGSLVIAILIVCFIAIPANKYNSALALYNNKQYSQALEDFKNLGTYRNSPEMVDTIEETLQAEQYQLAEDYYQSQQYAQALKIYNDLGEYRDSQKRIEQIYNMTAKDNEIYFGVYKGNPIAWKILKTEESRMLLITKNSVEQLAFHDEVKNITWETSSIKNWLNGKFLNEFSAEQKAQIVKSTPESSDIFLLTEDEYNTYSRYTSFEANSDWWLRTKTDAGMMFVYGENGKLNTTGESVIRALGVRPCVWISLK